MKALLLSLTVLTLTSTALADEDLLSSNSEQAPRAISMARVSLLEILDAVKQKTGQTFLVDVRVRPEVVVGQVDVVDVTYPVLLTILRNNDLAAAKVSDVVTIVPVATIRQFPLPVLYEDDESIADGEWVTRIVTLENAPAASLVPIMRPLLPQAGHLAANPASNTILIVDRYANVRRVTGMILALDEKTKSR